MTEPIELSRRCVLCREALSDHDGIRCRSEVHDAFAGPWTGDITFIPDRHPVTGEHARCAHCGLTWVGHIAYYCNTNPINGYRYVWHVDLSIVPEGCEP